MVLYRFLYFTIIPLKSILFSESSQYLTDMNFHVVEGQRI